MMRGTGSAAQSATVSIDFDEKKIDKIFRDLDQRILPGAAVGIAVDGKPVYRKGFGLAHMELPVVLSPTMRMRIGSATKHFTALAYLLLCEDGKAGIDDEIGKYLPELHPVSREVTLRQLMGNVGGLRDAFDISLQFSGTGLRVSSADLLALYRTIDDVNIAPNRTWIYNNGGYVMLSAAIERITGQTLASVLSERIFKPVGMNDTMLRLYETDFVSNSATGHMTTASGGFEKSYLGVALDGQGGIVSTVDDMLRWLSHMDAPVIGSPATWKALKSPQRLENGTSTGYGLGLYTEAYRGVETLAHAGGMMGSNSQMLKVPAVGLDVAIMVNRHDVSGIELTNKVLDACLSGLAPAKKNSGAFVTGVFRSPSTGCVVRLFPKNGKQIVETNGMELPVEADADGVMRPSSGVGFFRQELRVLGDPYQPTSIRFSDFGNPDELTAVPAAGDGNVGSITGRYVSTSTDTEAIISKTEEGARLTTNGRFGSVQFHLEYLADGIWFKSTKTPMPLGGILSFDASGDAFRLTTSRTWALTFRRAR